MKKTFARHEEGRIVGSALRRVLHVVEAARLVYANLALRADPRFRDLFDGVVYVPAASRVAYSGPIANEPRWEDWLLAPRRPC
jgi:hypothetical protein